MFLHHFSNFRHGARTPTTTLGSYRATFILGPDVGKFRLSYWDDVKFIPVLLKKGYGVGIKPGTTGATIGGNYLYSKRFQSLRTDLKSGNDRKYAMVREVYTNVRDGEDCLMVMTPMCDQFTGLKPLTIEGQIADWVQANIGISTNRIYR